MNGKRNIEQSKTEEFFLHQLDNNLKVEVTTKYKEIFCDEKNESNDLDDEAQSKEPKELQYSIEFNTETNEDLLLHWGLGTKSIADWSCPLKEIFPEGTKVFDSKAAQTKFANTNNLKKAISINLSITEENIIKALNYVFTIPSKNKWFNNDNKNYSIKFNSIKKNITKNNINIPEFVEDIVKCEVEYGSWTLMHRYNKCFDILNSINLDDEDLLLWIYIWLRYSYIRVLDWQRRFNTKPRELAYSMSRLTSFITQKYCSYANNKSENNTFKLKTDVILRMYLSMLGKGTGDGQQIRDEILQILHKHHIKESNDHFYEQWHQKLHNNTTPDDIVICEALLLYLRSNDLSQYWNYLKSKGVTKERLASFERKIVSEPFYKPELIGDLEHFLFTLKAVHSSDDMVLMFNSAKYCFNGNDYGKFQEIIQNKDHWDTLKQIYRVTDGRELLSKIILGNLHDSNKVRDMIFFDLCLETYLRQLVEKIIHISLEFDLYISEITAIVKNLCNTYKYKEFSLCLEDWLNISENLKNNIKNKNDYSTISALKIKSVSDRLSRTLSHIIDYFNVNFDPKARHLGNSFNADKFVTDIFTEETVRGSIFFTLSMILKKIEPILRKTANLGSWLVISRGKTLEPGKEVVKGQVEFIKSLQEVQFKTFSKPTILLTEQVGGNEEVPPNVTCLIIVSAKDYPDVLAHVSVRARNLGVPFFVCFDDAVSESLVKLNKTFTGLKMNNQNLEIVSIQEKEITNEMSKDNIEEHKVQSVKIPEGFPSIIIHMKDFNKSHVGAKSNNTKKVYGNLPNWVKYPESIAIPFNICEYFLDFDENTHIKSKLIELTKSLRANNEINISQILFECKKALMTLNFVNNSETQKLKSELINFGIKENEFAEAWKAIKGVWCSKYNERAYIATSKVGIKLDDIRMAVLVQKIIPADYAFVIHTKNPSTNNDNDLYAEVVVGMGETLVGTFEGQSFAFSHDKKSRKNQIHSYPNKSIILKNKGFIFRSDSNTEDLEGFAGAGLFDSIPMAEDKEFHMSYNMNELFTDDKFAENVMNQISNMGIEVENIYNYPQDIEGVIYNNEFYIVQTRPQV